MPDFITLCGPISADEILAATEIDKVVIANWVSWMIASGLVLETPSGFIQKTHNKVKTN